MTALLQVQTSKLQEKLNRTQDRHVSDSFTVKLFQLQSERLEHIE